MRTDPGFPADPTAPTRPEWRIVFDAATLDNQRVRATRVGQRTAQVVVDNEDADAGYVTTVEEATETDPRAHLELRYLAGAWSTQFTGVVTAPVYSQGRVTIELRVVEVAFYPTDRVVAPRYNHLPQPDALVAGEDSGVRVPNPGTPGT